MVRINCIPASDLLDQHLLAEYNEMAMAVAALRRSKATGRKLPSRQEYTLGTGHAIFFYDKGKYLKRRYDSLILELVKRGFKLDPNRVLEWEQFSDGLMNDWVPTPKAQRENVTRILQRMDLKPEWYKFYRSPIDVDFWRDHYSNWSFLEV